MKDYFALRGEMESEREGIATDGNLLDNANDALGLAQGLWEEHYDDFLDRLTNEYASKTGRMPGEDVRLSMARQENRDLWNEYQRAERVVKKIERRLRGRYAALEALRSELSAEKEQAKGEGFTPPGKQPDWSGQRG